MKLLKPLFTLLIVAGITTAVPAFAQMGQCPMCGRSWDGRDGRSFEIRENLPRPADEWLQQLSLAMEKEKLSQAQYIRDSRKFDLRMPYMRVIPDEENHISWINGLYQAFGEEYTAGVPPVKETGSPEEAYRLGMELEKELVPIYEWLIENTSDDQVRQVIETILFQTRMHQAMFQHALRMGGMMGRGMMGR